ncbi:hypothetical protein R6Q59_036175 [Mikania micrantha]
MVKNKRNEEFCENGFCAKFWVIATAKMRGEYPERPGQPECQSLLASYIKLCTDDSTTGCGLCSRMECLLILFKLDIGNLDQTHLLNELQFTP